MTQGNVGGEFGTEFRTAGNDNDATIKGSDKAIITDFEYEADNSDPMRGRWIAFRDPELHSVAVVEITGYATFITDDLVDTITDSLEVRH